MTEKLLTGTLSLNTKNKQTLDNELSHIMHFIVSSVKWPFYNNESV